MENLFQDLIHNQILVGTLLSWAVAQFLKFVIDGIMNRKLNFLKLHSDGGMPSCHSCTVTSLAILSGLYQGFGSYAFAISTIFAIIVMHDAAGVRLETGKQAKVINDITTLLKAMNPADPTKLHFELSEEKLKEFVGHTPIQVLAGSLLGILCAVVFYDIL